MPATVRSTATSRAGTSSHSFLFAFHVADVSLNPGVVADSAAVPVHLEWELSDCLGAGGVPLPSDAKGKNPVSTSRSPEFTLDGGRACNVDTVFALLQCGRSKERKPKVRNGILTIHLVSAGQSGARLGSVTFDARALEVIASLNVHSFKLTGAHGAAVGAVELCYVSQQRWVKVNKRKLAFLNEQRSSCMSSVVETSANYASCALDGQKETTPSEHGPAHGTAFQKMTPRDDEFILIFWNSMNTSFVKIHPEDYQLQLMLSFVRAPFVRGSSIDSSFEELPVSTQGDNASSVCNRGSAQLTEAGTARSRLVPGAGVLELPNMLRCQTETSGFSSASEFASDFTDEDLEDDGTDRSGLSAPKEPGSARLYDYLSQQNRLIQSRLTKQLSVDAMSSSSWTSVSRASVAHGVPGASNTARGTAGFESGFNSVVNSVMNSVRESELFSDYDDLTATNSMSARLVVRNVAPSTCSILDSIDQGVARTPDGSISSLRRTTTEAHDTVPVRQKTQVVKRPGCVTDADGFAVPTFIPRYGKSQMPGITANASASTVDAGSICMSTLASRSFNGAVPEGHESAGADANADEAALSGGSDDGAGSLLDAESNLDIVEDMNCAVVIEGTPLRGMSIDVDRFYAEQDDLPVGKVGHTTSTSHGSSTINNFYNASDDVEMDADVPYLLGASAHSPSGQAMKTSLLSAVYNAIMSDVSTLTISDLGIEYAECSLDAMSEALVDARALQVQQERLSTDLLTNFFLQLLSCHSKKGVPQVMLMSYVVQKHLSAADLMQFLPDDYNPTVIRVALDILVRQLGIALPGDKSVQHQLGTDYMLPAASATVSATHTLNRSETIHNEMVDQNSIDFFCPISECETYSEGSDVEDSFLPSAEMESSQRKLLHFQGILQSMYQQIEEMDPRKLVYISRLHSKPMKRRGCNLSLLAMKLALYRVFCGRRKLSTWRAYSVEV